jgi:hypothetical protein
LASGAISEALAMSVNTRFSSGRCCLITRRASAAVTASTRGEEFPYRDRLFVIGARRELVPRECLWRWRPGGLSRSSSLSFPLAACNSEAEPQRLGAGSRDLSESFQGPSGCRWPIGDDHSQQPVRHRSHWQASVFPGSSNESAKLLQS